MKQDYQSIYSCWNWLTSTCGFTYTQFHFLSSYYVFLLFMAIFLEIYSNMLTDFPHSFLNPLHSGLPSYHSSKIAFLKIISDLHIVKSNDHVHLTWPISKIQQLITHSPSSLKHFPHLTSRTAAINSTDILLTSLTPLSKYYFWNPDHRFDSRLVLVLYKERMCSKEDYKCWHL